MKTLILLTNAVTVIISAASLTLLVPFFVVNPVAVALSSVFFMFCCLGAVALGVVTD